MARPSDLEEREYLLGMRTFEQRAVIPLKWLMLGVSFFFLFYLGQPYWAFPEVEPFALFVLYGAFNLAQSYFFYLRRIDLHQIQPFVLFSFSVDLLFVSGLIVLDNQHAFGIETHPDLYVFYFLVILRGIAVFRSARGTLLMNLALTAIFAAASWQTFVRIADNPIQQSDLALKLVLIWMVMLVSWFIMDLINTQARQLIQARERLLRSEALASIGELAAGVAHEINNPVGIISANCEYLLRIAAPNDERREEIESIHKEAQRVQGIVAKLLDFSRPFSDARAECDMKVLNEDLLGFLFADRVAASEPQAVAHYAENLPSVWADAHQIKQALLNVYLNARQAVGASGRIEARFTAEPGGKTVRIAISDDGPGIADEALRRAFEPFYSNRPGGTGLGLTVTRRIVESHGGSIVIERLRPHGTRVVVFLPAASGARERRSGSKG